MAFLVLVRHGQSEWNALGLWTGHRDVGLTDKGVEEARKAAEHLRDITIHKAYTSKLSRAKKTLNEIKKALDYTELETNEHTALNERDYGEFTGKNKWEIGKQLGEEEFTRLRRSWDHPVPGGETLKDVYNRVLPYYQAHIKADLKAGKNVIVSAHGNTLRALMKYLDKIADDKVHMLEIGTGELLVYEISNDGKVLNKEIRSAGGKA